MHESYKGCLWLGNLDLDFNAAEISVLEFSLFAVVFFGISKKGLRKTVLRNRSFAPACIISKKTTTVQKNSFANPLSDSQLNSKEGNPWNLDLDLLIEIHPEDGFLESEIHSWVLRSNANLKFFLQKLNLDFPIDCNQTVILLFWLPA